jgi:hypothetical protein
MLTLVLFSSFFQLLHYRYQKGIGAQFYYKSNIVGRDRAQQRMLQKPLHLEVAPKGR